MAKQTADVGIAQINCKHQWPNAESRMHTMIVEAFHSDARIVTANEISKSQFDTVVNRTPWEGHFVTNDHKKNGEPTGDAIFWHSEEWSLYKNRKFMGRVEIDYRRGKKYGPKGRWYKRTLFSPYLRLVHNTHKKLKVDVREFHYPTTFNSTPAGRADCVEADSDWASVRINKQRNVLMGGDGNRLMPHADGLHCQADDGPDRLLSTGKFIHKNVMGFKLTKKSDHNGIVLITRFDIPA